VPQASLTIYLEQEQNYNLLGQPEHNSALQKAAKSLGLTDVQLRLQNAAASASTPAANAVPLDAVLADSAAAAVGDTGELPAEASAEAASDITKTQRKALTSREVIDLFDATELTEED
jgi:hypothetical protein